jgi:hypothetical protein
VEGIKYTATTEDREHNSRREKTSRAGRKGKNQQRVILEASKRKKRKRLS